MEIKKAKTGILKAVEECFDMSDVSGWRESKELAVLEDKITVILEELSFKSFREGKDLGESPICS